MPDLAEIGRQFQRALDANPLARRQYERSLRTAKQLAMARWEVTLLRDPLAREELLDLHTVLTIRRFRARKRWTGVLAYDSDVRIQLPQSAAWFLARLAWAYPYLLESIEIASNEKDPDSAGPDLGSQRRVRAIRAQVQGRLRGTPLADLVQSREGKGYWLTRLVLVDCEDRSRR